MHGFKSFSRMSTKPDPSNWNLKSPRQSHPWVLMGSECLIDQHYGSRSSVLSFEYCSRPAFLKPDSSLFGTRESSGETSELNPLPRLEFQHTPFYRQLLQNLEHDDDDFPVLTTRTGLSSSFRKRSRVFVPTRGHVMLEMT